MPYDQPQQYRPLNSWQHDCGWWSLLAPIHHSHTIRLTPTHLSARGYCLSGQAFRGEARQQTKGLHWSLPSLLSSSCAFQRLSLSLLFCLLEPALPPINSSTSHFPFTLIPHLLLSFFLPSFSFPPNHLPFDFMLSALTPLRVRAAPYLSNLAEIWQKYETPPPKHHLLAPFVSCHPVSCSIYPSILQRSGRMSATDGVITREGSKGTRSWKKGEGERPLQSPLLWQRCHQSVDWVITMSITQRSKQIGHPWGR